MDFYLGKKVEVVEKRRQAAAIAFLTADKVGKLKKIENLEKVSSAPGIVDIKIDKALGDFVQPPRDSTDRLGYVIASGNEPGQVKSDVLNTIRSINVEVE